MTLIKNSLGAHRTVSDFQTGRDVDGEVIFQPAIIEEYRANAAVAVGDVLHYVAATATVPLSVAPMATASSVLIFAGIALNAAAVGEIVQVVTYGHAIVRTGDVTTGLGQYLLKPATTAGVAVTSNTAIDATTVAGTVIGIVLGPDDGTFTPCYIKPAA